MLLFTIAEIAALIAGFFVAAELVADGTDKIEPLMGQGMAGGVVLGLLGSLPETIFVIIAVLAGSPGVAIGSAIGGNIILFTLGLGAVAIAYNIKWREPLRMKEDYHVELYFLGASSVGIILLILYGSLNLWSGLLLSAPYVVYILYRYRKARRMMRRSVRDPAARKLLLRGLAMMSAGIVMVTVLSGYFVQAINQLAGALGIAAIWLALVISPIAADLDENISGYRLAVRSRGGGSTAIVSYMGSKLQNNTLLLGLIGIIAVSPVSTGKSTPELLIVASINVLAIAFVVRRRFSYAMGVTMIVLYFVSVAAAFTL